MAKRSTPSSRPVNGRTSTKSLGRSKRPKPDEFGNQDSRNDPGFRIVTEPKARLRIQSQAGFRIHSLLYWFSGLQIPSCFPALVVPFCPSRRVNGAWWPARSSKPLSIPQARDRGRFDSYPLRQVIFDFGFSILDRRWIAKLESKLAIENPGRR